jgi:signal transduction histidine kinase
MGALVAGHDWTRTALGPLSHWSAPLRSAVALMLGWPAPAVLLWGREGLILFNDGYASLPVTIHPKHLGVSALEPPGAPGGVLARQVLAGETVSQRGRVFATESSAAAYLDLDYAPIRGEAEQPLGALGIIVDVSERVRASAATAQDELMSVLAHELRTPLSAVLLWSKMLRADLIDVQEQRRALVAIEEAALTQQRVLDDMVDASRLAVGKLALDRRQADLVAVVRAAAISAHALAELKGVTLRMSLPEGSVPVLMDAGRMERAVWNLLDQAINSTPSAGSVIVVAERVRNDLRIEVTDTGRGIAAEALPHVFNRLSSARNGNRTPGALGLAMARQVVELHGGTIGVHSAGQGQGATFSIALPLTQASGSFCHADHDQIHDQARDEAGDEAGHKGGDKAHAGSAGRRPIEHAGGPLRVPR